MISHLKNRKIILASQSPRRRFLLSQLGLDFTVTSGDVDESYPDGLKPEEIAIYLAEKKADHFKELLENPANIVITADTLVLINGDILGKPADRQEAFGMLQTLSGHMHQVVTGVTIRSREKSRTFTAWTDVYFKKLSDDEINFYLDQFRPFDKAGAYGIQEWIGYVGITRIDGSYFNVMGLPVQKLYEELSVF